MQHLQTQSQTSLILGNYYVITALYALGKTKRRPQTSRIPNRSQTPQIPKFPKVEDDNADDGDC